MKFFLRWLLVCGLTITAAAQNQKISQLPSGSPAVSTDLFPIARSGANYSLPISAITYTLPAATSSTLGGVKPDGTSIVNSSGAISVTPTSIGLGNVTNNAQVTGVTAGTGLTGGGTGGSLTLNVNWAAPGAGLGSTTPQSGAFTTLSATSGITAVSDGVHAGISSLVGNTANPSIPSNTWGFLGPSLASFTSWFIQPSSTGPTASCTMQLGAVSSGISALSCPTTPSFASISLGSSLPTCTFGTGGATCLGEGATSTAASGQDIIYGDSTYHQLMANNDAFANAASASFFPVEIDAINTQTASYSVVPQDSYVLCNKATAMTITLISTGIPSGKVYHIKNIGIGTCAVSESGIIIDGGAAGAGTSLGQYQAASFLWDGAQYWKF